MVTTNQKPTIDTQKLERKKHKYTTKENHQTTGKKLKEKEKTEKNYKNNQKKRNKMVISAYLSIITFNYSRLNAPIKRHRVVYCIRKTRPIYLLVTQDSLQS